MKKIKIIRLTDQEKKEIKQEYEKAENLNISLEEIYEQNDNQTSSVLKHIGDKHKEWEGIEKMVDYVNAQKKIKDCTGDEVELDNDEVRLIKSVIEEAVKNKTHALTIEKLTDVYSTFKV